MKVGTKSVLFGAHQFLIHPFWLFISWWKLYGFPWDPRLWVAFFVHDLGYYGKSNMDGEEGETHVELGAKIMGFLFDKKYVEMEYKKIPISKRKFSSLELSKYLDDGWKIKLEYQSCKSPNYFELERPRNNKHIKWHDFCLYHSRFYAKKDGKQYSKLCVADKYAICIEPWWLYLPRVNWSGEILEYMNASKNGDGKYKHMNITTENQHKWHKDMITYLKKWVKEHKEIKEDTWTEI